MTRERIFRSTIVEAVLAGRQPPGSAACENDAMRLCGEFGGDVQRITTCMSQKRRYLNPQCRVYFDGKRRSR